MAVKKLMEEKSYLSSIAAKPISGYEQYLRDIKLNNPMAYENEMSQRRAALSGAPTFSSTITPSKAQLAYDAGIKKLQELGKVDANGKIIVKDESGINAGGTIGGQDIGTPIASPGLTNTDIPAMINQLAEQQKKSAQAQLEASRQAALSGLGQERTLAEQSQRTQVGQARTLSSQGARSFNEYLANKGLSTSGSAAQGELAQNIALQGAESAIGQDTANILQGIEAKRTLAESNYANDLEKTYSDIEASRQAGLISNTQAEIERKNATDQFNASQALSKEQFAISQAENQKAREEDNKRYADEVSRKLEEQQYQREIDAAQTEYDRSRQTELDTWNRYVDTQNIKIKNKAQKLAEKKAKQAYETARARVAISAGNLALAKKKYANKGNSGGSSGSKSKSGKTTGLEGLYE